jgi:hypothetical protein
MMRSKAGFQKLYYGPGWSDVYLLPLAAFKIFWRHYSHERGKKRESYPSISSLCEKCNLTRNTVIAARRWLVKNGWLVKVGERRTEGKFAVPVFRVDHGVIPEEIRTAAQKKGHGGEDTAAQNMGHGSENTAAQNMGPDQAQNMGLEVE